MKFNCYNLSTAQDESVCWKCGSILSKYDLFCIATPCTVIQKLKIVHGFNIFKLFGFDPHYDIEVNELDRRFRDLQAKLHPDKFSIKSSSERDASHESSSTVNQAYQVTVNGIP